jgi:hypothetical protein
MPPTAPADYCREIEAYLCRKNDGHLIRIVGPSFDLVSGWAVQGVPLTIAFAGIDRYFERYYRKGRPRRRPVRIDFCEADVQDVFDEWRRVVGLARSPDAAGDDREQAPARAGRSLPAHLERVVLRLTDARVAGRLDPGADAVIDRIAGELDTLLASARALRGEPRRELIERLAALDRELLDAAYASLDPAERERFGRTAGSELAPFRDRMNEAAYERARRAILDRCTREQFRLPVVAFS